MLAMIDRKHNIGLHPTMRGTETMEPVAAHQTRAARRIECCREDLRIALGWLEEADGDAAAELSTLMRQLGSLAYRLDKSDS